MTPFILALAGGTGSGKTTLAKGLSSHYESKSLIIHLDDYFRPPPEVPKFGKHVVFDHPDSVNSQQLGEDLAKLKQGRSSEITRRDKDGVREYDIYDPRKRIRVEPKQLIILEGFLALHYPELRSLYDYSVYLDAPFDSRLKRRVHFMSDDYKENVLRDLHAKYVETSKEHADFVIDAEKNDKDIVLNIVLGILEPRLKHIANS